jgi:hypothetical protein
MAAKPQVGFLGCAIARRPAGPAESSALHDFARSGPTKEAHRRAFYRSGGLQRSEAGRVRRRGGATARVGGRGWWQQRLDALPQPIGQELVGQDDHERSSSPITHPTSASWVAVGVRFAGRAALLRGCHPATSHTPSLKQHRCSRHRRTARPKITTRWSGRASGCTCTSAPAGTTRREARRRAAALYRCRPVAFAGLDPVAVATRRPPRPARPRGHNGRTRLGDATGGRASHEGVRL